MNSSKGLRCALLSAYLTFAAATVHADTEVLVIRHAEKPSEGRGQITCQGLNRALALPFVLEARYGRPDAVIAPDPGREKADRGTIYSYVRPLATIEPAAVYFDLPVNATLGFDDTEGLKRRLNEMVASRKYRRILVAWEHHLAAKVVRELLNTSDAKALVPAWPGHDFDSIYLLRFKDSGAVEFRHEKQGLDGLPLECPKPSVASSDRNRSTSEE